MKLRKLIAAGAAALTLGVVAAPALGAKTYSGITYDASEPYVNGYYPNPQTLVGPASLRGTATKNLTVDVWFTQKASDGYYWANNSDWRRQYTILRGQTVNSWPTIYNACPRGSSRSYRMEVRIWGASWDISGARTLSCG